ncbi:MAG: DUF4214 domain-containing protein [Oscillospiraceae bacterium]|nr:DUF4214 domain-containing protein [Oscillospiraceae bacterium]
MKRKLLRPIAIVLMTALALSLTLSPLTAVADDAVSLPPWTSNPGFDLTFEEGVKGSSAVFVYNHNEYDESDEETYTYREFYIVNAANVIKLVLTFGKDITSATIGVAKNVNTATIGEDEDSNILTITLKDFDNNYTNRMSRLPVVVDGETYYLAFYNFAGVHYNITGSGSVTQTEGAEAPATRRNGQLSVFDAEQIITVTPLPGGSIKSFTVEGEDNFEDLAIDENGVGTVTLPYTGGSPNALYYVAVEFVSPPAPPPSAPPAPSMPWTDPEPNTPDSFLASLYFAALGRTPDEGGFDDWADALESGAMTATDVVYGFVFSPEMVTKNLSDEEYVVMLYAAFFARDPDEGGKAHWLGRLASGATRYDVFLGFANSVEFDVFCDAHGFVRV